MEEQLFLFPTEELTSSPQAVRAKISRSPENEPEERREAALAQASSSSLSALLAKYGPDGSSTKTWSECSLRTRAEILPTSSWRFGTAGIVSRTGLWTRPSPVVPFSALVHAFKALGAAGPGTVLATSPAAHLTWLSPPCPPPHHMDQVQSFRIPGGHVPAPSLV